MERSANRLYGRPCGWRAPEVAPLQTRDDECVAGWMPVIGSSRIASLEGRIVSSSPSFPSNLPIDSAGRRAIGPGRQRPQLPGTSVRSRRDRLARQNRGRSIRGLVVMNPRRSTSRRSPALLMSCPRCGLTIRPKVHWLAIEHCPRCLAHARVAVRLISPPSTGDIGHRHPRPALRSDRPGTLAVDRSRSR